MDNIRLITEQLKKMMLDSKNCQQIVDVYTDLIHSCEELGETLDHLSAPGKEGELPLVGAKEREEVLLRYQKVAGSIDGVRELPSGRDTDGLKYLSSYLEKIIGKDMKGFIAMENPSTIKDILESSRRSFIENDQSAERVGGNLSSRMVVSYENNGRQIKGVFTPSSRYQGSETKWKELGEKYASSYPQHASIIDKIVKGESYRAVSKSYVSMNGKNIDYDDYVFAIRELSSTIPQDRDLADELEQALATDTQFSISFYRFIDECALTNNYIEINEKVVGYDKKESIDERNCAMSMVAEMLNNKDLLVHSETCSVEQNGQIIDGSIMNFAGGVDINNLAPDDEFRNLTEKDADTPSLKEQLANLQVIDYLCGNVDRHCANMFYQVHDGKITGIVGIDNDASFPKDNDMLLNTMQNPGLVGLGVIDETLAKRIATLTPAMLKLGLRGYNISEEAIEKSAERLRDLQSVLREAPVYDGSPLVFSESGANQLGEVKLTIVPTDKWKDLSLGELANKATSYFNSVQMLTSTQKDLQPTIKEMKEESMFKKFEVVTESAKNANALSKIEEEMEKATSFFRGSSKLYKDIREGVKNLSSSLKTIDGEYTKEAVGGYLESFKNLSALTKQYIDSKQGKKNNDYTNKRLGIITNLNNILKDGFNNFESKTKDSEKLDKKIDSYVAYAEDQALKAENENLHEKLKKDGDITDIMYKEERNTSLPTLSKDGIKVER